MLLPASGKQYESGQDLYQVIAETEFLSMESPEFLQVIKELIPDQRKGLIAGEVLLGNEIKEWRALMHTEKLTGITGIKIIVSLAVEEHQNTASREIILFSHQTIGKLTARLQLTIATCIAEITENALPTILPNGKIAVIEKN